eukprot:1678971-Pyramimonas_sp.AAC.1
MHMCRRRYTYSAVSAQGTGISKTRGEVSQHRPAAESSEARRSHGDGIHQAFRQADRQAGDAHPDGGPRRRWQDHDPVQAEARRGRHDDPDDRLQRGDGRVQEHQLHRVGRRRPGQDPPAVAPLLPGHAGPHLR